MRASAILVAILAVPTLTAAQGAVGSGPLTGALVDSEPQTGVFSLGPLKLAPGMTIRELGRDDNVFDEALNPKRDFVAAGTPDVSAFARLRLLQVSAYGGVEMQYYKKYTGERSITPAVRGRVDFLLSRVRPFVGAGETKTRTRPNGEIDVRANLVQDELSGGVAYELSVHAIAFGSAIMTKTRFSDAKQNDVDLAQSLGRNGTEYMAGVRTDLTPLLSLQVRGSYKKDEFVREPARNGESQSATAVFVFSPAAVITGSATVGYQDYKPVDPLVERYKGLTGSGFITYAFLELARVNLGYSRGIDYSFDTTEAYFLQDSMNLSYTMRIAGELDWQARGSLSLFDYGHRVGSVPRRDTLREYGGSLGYNLRNRTRIAANYEYSERQSPEVAARNYLRRRVFLNWAFAF